MERAPDEDHGPLPSERFAAFVRNVMVGREGLSADVLRECVAHAGGREPRSHLATGNLTFSAAPAAVDMIGAKIEGCIEAVLGRREEVFIRSLDSLASAVSSEPFAGMAAEDVYERCITFLPSAALAVTLPLKLPIRTPRGDADLFALAADGVLSVTHLVGGRPGLPGRYLEAALGIRATTRNWNTIERIVRLEA